MATKPLPDQALLLKLLRYEPDTGHLFWRERSLKMFSDGGVGAEATCRTWNRNYAGKQVSPCPSPKGAHGYAQTTIQQKKYLVHRLIWKMVTGDDPDQIDHINGNRTDNRFANLRSVSCSDNLRNIRRRDQNKSGCTGVFYHKAARKWLATINHEGKRVNLGLHVRKEDAIRARKAAERKVGYHPNHGRPGAA